MTLLSLLSFSVIDDNKLRNNQEETITEQISLMAVIGIMMFFISAVLMGTGILPDIFN